MIPKQFVAKQVKRQGQSLPVRQSHQSANSVQAHMTPVILIQRAIDNPNRETLTLNVLRTLQTTHGNQFVQRLIARRESRDSSLSDTIQRDPIYNPLTGTYYDPKIPRATLIPIGGTGDGKTMYRIKESGIIFFFKNGQYYDENMSPVDNPERWGQLEQVVYADDRPPPPDDDRGGIAIQAPSLANIAMRRFTRLSIILYGANLLHMPIMLLPELVPTEGVHLDEVTITNNETNIPDAVVEFNNLSRALFEAGVLHEPIMINQRGERRLRVLQIEQLSEEELFRMELIRRILRSKEFVNLSIDKIMLLIDAIFTQRQLIQKARSQAQELLLNGRPPEEIVKLMSSYARAIVQYIARTFLALMDAQDRDFAVIASGSFARGEMFPFSDLDVGVLTRGDRSRDFVGLFVSFLNLNTALLDVTVGGMAATPLEMDFNLSFREDPNELAEMLLALQNSAQDTDLLFASSELAQAYFQQFAVGVRSQVTKRHSLSQIGDRLTEFMFPKKLADEIDIKKAFLRFITLVMRDVAQYFIIEEKDTWNRIRALIEKGVISEDLGIKLLKALDFLADLRARLHLRFQSERDTVLIRAMREGQYTLTGPELDRLIEINELFTLFHIRLSQFVQTGNPQSLNPQAQQPQSNTNPFKGFMRKFF